MAIYRGTGSASTTTDQATIDEVTTQATNAANSATSAASSASSAASSASSASSSASTATTQASAASSSATSAASSASAASTSATNAATSATAAAASATTAASEATNAETAETGALAARADAINAQTASESARDLAQSYKTAAETAYTNTQSTINAAVATATADAEAAQAAAETAQTAAETAETNATTQATNAATSASNASTSATNAASSATSASTAQTAAETAQTAAETALDAFDDRYLGAKSSAPTVDNDGDPLITGALYYDTTASQLYIWTGSAWDQAAFSVSGAVTSFNTRTGAVTLSSTDVTTALGYTPSQASDITTAINNLVNAAPAALDTLDELAAALGDDANFSVTITNSIATKVSKSGDTMTGNLYFGDSNKAIFGAGNDLQIYHDSLHSYIQDAGTGNLRLCGDNMNIMNAAATKNYIACFPNAQVDIKYDNATKLATTSTGVDVTGTVTADGLTVDTNTLYVDATNNRVGIGTSSPSTTLHVKASTAQITLEDSDVAGATSVIYGNGVGGLELDADPNNAVAGSYMRVKVDGTERMRIDGGGNLGLGTTSTSKGKANIVNSTKDAATYIQNTYAVPNNNDSGALYILDQASGNRGSVLNVRANTAHTGGSVARINVENASSTSTGLYINNAGTGYALNVDNSLYIDSSGNLLVGKTAIGQGTAGFEARASGQTFCTDDGAAPLIVNRLTSDGQIIQINKDGTTVGSIGNSNGSAPGDLFICSSQASHAGLSFGGNQVVPTDNVGALNDATCNLGASANRFKDLYLSGTGYFGTRIGIGTTNPNRELQVGDNTGAEVISIQSGNAHDGSLMFGDDQTTSAEYRGMIRYSHSSDAMRFFTSSTEQMRIDSSGSLLVNGTLSVGSLIATSTVQQMALNNGQMGLSRSGVPLILNRITSDGAVLQLRQDGTVFGSLEVSGSDLVTVSAGQHRFYTSTSNEDMRLETDGDLHVDGDVIAYSTTISDERLKTNIQGIENAVAKVSQLNGYTFEYTADGKISAGVIAQEVEKVLPEAVSEKQLPLKADDEQEYKVVNYDALHGLLIEAIKEQQAQIELLTAKVEALEAK